MAGGDSGPCGELRQIGGCFINHFWVAQMLNETKAFL